MDKKSYNHDSQTQIKRSTLIGKVDNGIWNLVQKWYGHKKKYTLTSFISSDTQFNYCTNFLSV